MNQIKEMEHSCHFLAIYRVFLHLQTTKIKNKTSAFYRQQKSKTKQARSIRRKIKNSSQTNACATTKNQWSYSASSRPNSTKGFDSTS